MNPLTTIEQMCVEGLRGNITAAKALADLLREDESVGTSLPPVQRIVHDFHRLRVVIYAPMETSTGQLVEVDTEGMREAIANWLMYGEPLFLHGVRIELYELTGPLPAPDPIPGGPSV